MFTPTELLEALRRGDIIRYTSPMSHKVCDLMSVPSNKEMLLLYVGPPDTMWWDTRGRTFWMNGEELRDLSLAEIPNPQIIEGKIKCVKLLQTL